jgi:integrase
MLTVKAIDALKVPSDKDEAYLWDDGLGAVPGFGVRAYATGGRKFIFRYRLGRKQRNVVIGPVLATGKAIDEARDIARNHSNEVRAGNDPAIKREVAIQEASQTFASLAAEFLPEMQPDWSSGHYSDVKRTLEVRCASLRQLPVTKVLQADVAVVLNRTAKESGRVAANRAHAHLGKFFSWVLSRGIRLPEGHPVEYIAKYAETSRERVLTHDELRRIWNACDPDDGYGAIVRLLMLTGCRLREIGCLRSDEIKDARPDLPQAQFQLELKAERVKNGRAHIVPLTDQALSIINRFPRDHVCLFGRSKEGFRGYDMAKARLNVRIATKGEGIEDWGHHDLRRTMATLMAEELHIQPHIIEAVINHVSGHKAGVAGIYNRASYLPERRQALTLWAEHLLAIVEGRSSKVVPLKRA